MTKPTRNGRGDRSGERYLEHSIPLKDERLVLESQVRECYGRAAYSHKTHEKMADRRASDHRLIKWSQITLSALTASGAIGVLFADAPWLPYATAIVSLLTLVVAGYTKDLDPGVAAQRHREAASDIWNVRESYLSLLTDLRDPSTPIADLRRQRDDLQARLYQVYNGAPHTDSKGYSRAQEALQHQEDLSFSEDEIDRLLPQSLRRKRP